MAEKKAALWGIVLAGGEGNRLKRFIQEYFGTDAPRQFCAFVGRRTMIEQTLRRAETIIPRKRLVVVATAPHRRPWCNKRGKVRLNCGFALEL